MAKISVLGGLVISAGLLLVTSCSSGVAGSRESTQSQGEVGAIAPLSVATAEQAEQLDASVKQADPRAQRYFVDAAGVAIRGADPVAYFTEGAVVFGSSEFTHAWGNATWQFASAENRDLFAANPEQYAPQYGGFCAWAVSQGYTASIDPESWRIVEGRLYLNYDSGIQRRWERDISGNIAKADANWPGVLNES
ncbi:MAG: YHS domain-containing (seleno)protein [Cyanobacteria bacterium J06627_28]